MKLITMQALHFRQPGLGFQNIRNHPKDQTMFDGNSGLNDGGVVRTRANIFEKFLADLQFVDCPLLRVGQR